MVTEILTHIFKKQIHTQSHKQTNLKYYMVDFQNL